MNFLKKLFSKTATSDSSQSETIVSSSQQSTDSPLVKTSSKELTNAQEGKSESSLHVERVISKVKELNLRMKPLLKSTWPGTPEWDQLMTLSNEQVEIARSIIPADFHLLEPFLKDKDAETRRSSAYIVKAIHQNSLTIPISTNIITLLGSLLHDSNLDVRDTALDTLHIVSKTTAIDAASEDLISSISKVEKVKKMNVIEALSNSHLKTEIIVTTLKKLTKEDSADIATAARNALIKLGIDQEQEDEKAVVQKLLWTWKSSGYGRFQTEDAYEELKKFPNPRVVCSVFKATLLKGEWTSDFMAANWPSELGKLLAEIGDNRFLDDLISLYLQFEEKSAWKGWSGYIALAILRIQGGWDRIRKEFKKNEIIRLIQQALLVSSFDGGDEVIDYHEYLSEDEKTQIISNLMANEKGYSVTTLCNALKRIRLSALDSLLFLYNKDESKKAAAEAICMMPEALDSLSLRLSPAQIEDIISLYYTYTGGMYWNENLIRFMAKFKTEKCITYLNQEALKRYNNPEVSAERKALIESLQSGN